LAIHKKITMHWRYAQKKQIIWKLLVIMLFVLLAELLVRRFFPIQSYFDPEIYQFNPTLGKTLRKNLCISLPGWDNQSIIYRTNAQGWRDNKDFSIKKSPGVKRIIFLGDSFVEAGGVPFEKTLPKVVERSLDNRGLSCECLNFAMSDIGQGEEYLIFQKYAKKYNPDIVILVLFPLNDIVNNTLFYAGKNQAEGDWVRPYVTFSPKNEEHITYLHPCFAFLRQHSFLFQFFEIRGLIILKELANQGKYLSHEKRLKKERTQRGELPYIENMVYLKSSIPDEWNSACKNTMTLILKTREAVIKSGAEFYVIVLPYESQMIKNNDYRDDVIDKNHILHSYYFNTDQPEEMFSTLFENNNINGFFALYPLRNYLKKTGAPINSIWPPNIGHLNKQGLSITGEAFSEFIYKQLTAKK
jgi:hypothetical protein